MDVERTYPVTHTAIRNVSRSVNVIHIALEVEIELGSFGNSCARARVTSSPLDSDRYRTPFTRTSGEMYADPACPFRLHYGCTLHEAAER